MAAANSNIFTRPDFPQLLQDAIDRVFASVERVQDATGKTSSLSVCSYESPETRLNACNGFPCCDRAIVFDLRSERELCAKHFRTISFEHALEDLEADRG